MTVSFVPCIQCPNQCSEVFELVVVSYLIKGYTLVRWELLPTFTDIGPLTFQLQFGRTANQNADDWIDVGGPVTDIYFAYDAEQRVWGSDNWAFYRVKVTSAHGQYVSLPVNADGTLSKRDWLKLRNLARRKHTTFRMGEAQEGYLLKRRVTGVPCPTCLDFLTKEVRDPNCVDCYGTGFSCGYFYPSSCVWAAISPKSRRIHLDGEQRATINDVVVQAQMLLIEMMEENDVWVSKLTDDRYYMHKIEHTAEVRGVPIIGNVEMRPIPFSSAVYTIEIPEQLIALGLDPNA